MSTETKHTSGPWICLDDNPFVYALNDSDTNRFNLSVQGGHTRKDKYQEHIRTSKEEIQANARLIAAAPDLLEALKCLQKRGLTTATWGLCLKAITKAETK